MDATPDADSEDSDDEEDEEDSEDGEGGTSLDGVRSQLWDLKQAY